MRERAQPVLISGAQFAPVGLMERAPTALNWRRRRKGHGGRWPRTACGGLGVCRSTNGRARCLRPAAGWMPDARGRVVARKVDATVPDRRRLRSKPSLGRRAMRRDRDHSPGVRPDGAGVGAWLGRTNRWPPTRYLVAGLDDLGGAAELPPARAWQTEPRPGGCAYPLQVAACHRHATADGGRARMAGQAARLE